MFSPLLSPDLSRLPQALILTAEIDPLADDGRLYAEALNEAGTKAVSFTSPGAYHGFMQYRDAPGRKEGECAIRQFLAGRPLENVQFCTEADLRKARNTTSEG